MSPPPPIAEDFRSWGDHITNIGDWGLTFRGEINHETRQGLYFKRAKILKPARIRVYFN